MDSKSCSRCGCVLPADSVHFGSSSYTKSGLTSWCRGCLRAREKGRVRTYPEGYHHAQYVLKRDTLTPKMKAAYERNRDFVQFVKGTCVCESCGIAKGLTFHHRDKDSKKFMLSNSGVGFRSIDAIVEEMKKCTVLCKSCHSRLHMAEKSRGDGGRLLKAIG